MNDVFDHNLPKAARTLAEYHVKRMVLSPEHWRACSLPTRLAWQIVPFTKASADRVPDDSKGVYTFLVQPGIADHPACSYLLYVGQTERQGFRARYQQYLRELRAGEESRRPHITEMLEKWDGHLWFCFAPVSRDDHITEIEDALLAGYLPPANKDFPAKVSRALLFFLRSRKPGTGVSPALTGAFFFPARYSHS